FGVGRGSNIARGMFIILVYQTTIFDKMLIAGASSITARGAIEKFGQVDVLKSAALMLIAIALWITDFVHHIPAPMIGLGVGLLAIFPVVGVLDTRDVRSINFLPIFF